jgi:Na+-transporting NADH:ubiquinone oxidoreductase subunit C
VESPSKASHSDLKVIIFITSLCFICALLLAGAAFSLEKPQARAKEFDQSKQMLIAAKILNHAGYFQLLNKDGTTSRARFDPESKLLIEDENVLLATDAEIREVADLRIRSLLTDKQGNVYTLEEKKITLEEYLASNKKTGYANLPLKLFYAILANDKESSELQAQEIAKDLSKIEIYVIPVSGFGLWAPIYGFLALEPDGDTVVGTTWYEHGETPGLGANIAEPGWQKQFYGKVIFQETSSGKVDYKTADMGIIVVKGKVKEVYGNSSKAKSAVDGMSGATLTGDGVTQAYRNSLNPYRNFLIKVQKTKEKENG